jgi:hypothetical protein
VMRIAVINSNTHTVPQVPTKAPPESRGQDPTGDRSY